MTRSPQFSDEMWARIEPLMPRGGAKGGRPWNDHRRTVEGICWRLRTGSPWRDVPAEFGSWSSLWRRFNAWAQDGTWDKILTAIAGSPEAEGLVAVVDGTIVRAHKEPVKLSVCEWVGSLSVDVVVESVGEGDEEGAEGSLPALCGSPRIVEGFLMRLPGRAPCCSRS